MGVIYSNTGPVGSVIEAITRSDSQARMGSKPWSVLLLLSISFFGNKMERAPTVPNGDLAERSHWCQCQSDANFSKIVK